MSLGDNRLGVTDGRKRSRCAPVWSMVCGDGGGGSGGGGGGGGGSGDDRRKKTKNAEPNAVAVRRVLCATLILHYSRKSHVSLKSQCRHAADVAQVVRLSTLVDSSDAATATAIAFRLLPHRLNRIRTRVFIYVKLKRCRCIISDIRTYNYTDSVLSISIPIRVTSIPVDRTGVCVKCDTCICIHRNTHAPV